MRRSMMLVIAFALASSSLVVVESAAHAATISGGALAAGTQTTVALAPGDETTFDVVIPPGTHPTITVSSLTPGAFVTATLTQLFGFQYGSFTGDDPTSWYADMETNTGTEPLADTLRLQSYNGDATLTFTLDYAGDQKQDVAPGVAVPVTFTHPGERALLTFDAGLQDTVTVHVTDVALTTAGPRDPNQPALSAYFTAPYAGPPLAETSPGDYAPFTLGGDGPFTLAIDPTFDRVGTLTVTIDVTPGTVGTLTYGQATQVTLDRPTRVRRYSLTTQATAPTLVRAFLPNLLKADGTPGTATFELTLAGSAVASGTISDQSIVTIPAGTLPDAADALLTVTADAASTGTLTVSIQLDPGPSTPVTVGTPTPVSLPVGATTSRYSMTASEGQVFEVYLSDVAFTDPAFLGQVMVSFESPFGFVTDFPAQVTGFDTTLATGFRASVAGTWTMILSRPELEPDTSVGMSATMLPVKQVTVPLSRTMPLDQTISLPEPAQVLEVTVPGHAGHRVVVRLTDQVWTGPPDQYGNPPRARLRMGGAAETNDSETRFSTSGDWYLESLPLPQDGPVQVWVDPEATATGTARLVAYEPQDTTGVLAPEGSPTTITVGQAGAVARYTFQGTAGDPFALDVPTVNLTGSAQAEPVGIAVYGPDGSFTGTDVLTGQQMWFEVPGSTSSSGVPVLPSTGTYTVEVDPHGDSTGTVVVTRTRPKIITSAIRSGQRQTFTFARGDVRRLTFAGKAGQRPVLQFSGQTLTTGVRLVDPAGQPAGELSQSSDLRFGEFDPLPATGTWTLAIDPPGASTGTLTARFDLVTDPVRTAAPGDPVRTSWTVGQNPTFKVKVKKGERVAVDVRSADNLSLSGAVSVAIRAPGLDFVAGGVIGTPESYQPPPPIWIEGQLTAPADDTWTVVVDPIMGTTGSVTFVVRTAADQVIADRLGKWTTVSVDKPVQNVALPFTVASVATPKYVHWRVKGSTFAHAQLQLVSPFGYASEVVDIPRGDSSGTFYSSIWLTGGWSVVVDPLDGATGKATIRVSLSDTF